MNLSSPTSAKPGASSRRPASGPLVILFILAGFIAGIVVGQSFTIQVPGPGGRQLVNITRTAPSYVSKEVDFNLFWRVWDYVKANYLVQPITETDLFYGSLEGMVASLSDPYSVFMDPAMAEQFNKELSGSFEGIGSEVGIKNDHLVIIAPLPDSPAERAGLRPGDRVLAIGGVDTSGLALDYAVSLIRGKRDTKVKLVILSSGDTEPKELEIVRAVIKVDILRSELKTLSNGRKVGYMRLVHFTQESDASFVKAWQALAAQGAQGLILDLRNNPGGFLDIAVELASHWIKEGTVVKEQYTGAQVKVHEANGKGELGDLPTIVLVNQGSASASEIVAGALQDYKLATLVGETTFGKGSVQDYQSFPDGSSIKLTIANWLTPLGRQIDKEGITPDIMVPLTADDYEADKDPQLDKALELLSL
ncbi:TPA: hypothetical protein DIC39_00705 [Patescibacteria group bacterium]|nr:hypothetical protein [Patescibacteria group bacterium]HCU47571.1 hypothetical protein [Patescibacteria group bacterium]